MTNTTLFTERQRFKQWWLWLTLIAIDVLLLSAVVRQVAGEQQFGLQPTIDAGLLIAAGTTMLLTLLFISFRLDFYIKDDGIYVRLFPFHIRFKHYAWETLTKSYVREYSAISEYGGWGLRIGLFGRGTALNMSGDKGLQLEFTNNKKLLIGTNKPDELAETLNTIGQLKQ